MSSVVYFDPTYYSPYYFAPLAAGQGGGVGPSPPPGYRDRDAYAAIIAALTATGEFADVLLGNARDQGATGVDRVPLALVTPDEWSETDDGDPIAPLRRVVFRVTLLVRADAPGQRFDELDRLSSLVKNALDGSDLNGGCLPALTRLGRGRSDPAARHPESRMVLEGEFVYLVPSLTSHDTTP